MGAQTSTGDGTVSSKPKKFGKLSNGLSLQIKPRTLSLNESNKSNTSEVIRRRPPMIAPPAINTDSKENKDNSNYINNSNAAVTPLPQDVEPKSASLAE